MSKHRRLAMQYVSCFWAFSCTSLWETAMALWSLLLLPPTTAALQCDLSFCMLEHCSWQPLWLTQLLYLDTFRAYAVSSTCVTTTSVVSNWSKRREIVLAASVCNHMFTCSQQWWKVTQILGTYPRKAWAWHSLQTQLGWEQWFLGCAQAWPRFRSVNRGQARAWRCGPLGIKREVVMKKGEERLCAMTATHWCHNEKRPWFLDLVWTRWHKRSFLGLA